MTLPRPDLADRLGVTYRRIPVLAIGKDVYCDSSLIASVLERRFPASEGFGTLFPKRNGGGKADTGIIKAFSMNVYCIGQRSCKSNTLQDAKFYCKAHCHT